MGRSIRSSVGMGDEDNEEDSNLTEESVEPSESEENETVGDYKVVKETENVAELKHKDTGEILYVCKVCDGKFSTPSTSKMGVHQNPRAKRFYCSALEARDRARGVKRIDRNESQTPIKKFNKEVTEKEEPFDSSSVIGEQEESSDETLLKTPPNPVRVLARILDIYPQIKGAVKKYVLQMCEPLGDKLDGTTIYHHLVSMDGVSDVKARYIVEEFNRQLSAAIQDYQKAQMSMSWGGSAPTSVSGVSPPPGYGSRYGQEDPYRMRGQPQPQWMMTPYGPQPMMPFMPQMPQRDDRELVDMRRAMESQAKAFEAGMRSIAEAIKDKPKSEEGDTMMKFLLNQQNMLMKELMTRDNKKGESDDTKELKDEIKQMNKKMEAKELDSIRNELSQKIDKLEAQGESAESAEINRLREDIQVLAERSGSRELSDEAKVTLTEVSAASKERMQFYSESRFLLGKLIDYHASKEGIRLTDNDRKKIDESDSLVDEEDLEQLEEKLEGKKKKKK